MAWLRNLTAGRLGLFTFTATYSPTGDQVAAVEQYLTSLGLANVQAEPNTLFVTADETAASAPSAFNTHSALFSHNGAQIYANTTTAQILDALSGVVAAAFGRSVSWVGAA